MEARLSRVYWTLEGYNRTGIPLVGWIEPKFFPAEDSDDFGLYYICLRLVKAFDLNPQQAILTVQIVFILVALALCILGVVLLFRQSTREINLHE